MIPLQEAVIKTNPDYEYMKKLNIESIKGVGVTAQINGKYDFVSRYFNPWVGVNEDSVTGSVHTLLATYWSDILNKNELRAYQASERGGEISLKLKENNHIELIGKAVLVFEGKIFLN